MSEYKAILNADGTFRGLVLIDASTAPEQTRAWVPTEPPPVLDNEVLVQLDPLITEIEAIQQWTTRPKARDERVPAEIATWRFRSAIKLTGKYDAVLAVLAALEEPTKTVAFEQFEYSNTTERDHPLIEALGAQVGLNRDQLDDLFVLGASLT